MKEARITYTENFVMAETANGLRSLINMKFTIYTYFGEVHFRGFANDLKVDMSAANIDEILCKLQSINMEFYEYVDWIMRGYAGARFNNSLLTRGTQK